LGVAAKPNIFIWLLVKGNIIVRFLMHTDSVCQIAKE
jgi:hypothetical protein